MVDDTELRFLKDMLGYTDTQWKIWKNNPRNQKIVGNLKEIQRYKVIFEVISSVGCAAAHKVGDQIISNGGGTLLCKESPEKICLGLLAPMLPIAFMVLDKISLGEDPTQIAFPYVHCADVGVDLGGWGEVVVEAKVEKAKE